MPSGASYRCLSLISNVGNDQMSAKPGADKSHDRRDEQRLTDLAGAAKPQSTPLVPVFT